MMKKWSWLVPGCALTLLLTGFTGLPQGQATGTTGSGQLYTAEVSTMDRTAAGQDRDLNGIRDDVDALIALKYTQSARQTLAAQRLARELQKTAVHQAPTRDQAIAQFQSTLTADYCLILFTSGLDQVNVNQRLTGATYNTVLRIRNLERHERLASGTAFTAPRNAVCYH